MILCTSDMICVGGSLRAFQLQQLPAFARCPRPTHLISILLNIPQFQLSNPFLHIPRQTLQLALVNHPRDFLGKVLDELCDRGRARVDGPVGRVDEQRECGLSQGRDDRWEVLVERGRERKEGQGKRTVESPLYRRITSSLSLQLPPQPAPSLHPLHLPTS